MIRSALDAIADLLGYERRRPLLMVKAEGPGEPFTRAHADSALKMAFVQGVPVGMLMDYVGPDNRDLKITLTFRHRTPA